MRAKEVTAKFHTCEGCDKADAVLSINPERAPKTTLRSGDINIIEGWADSDDDWIGSKEDYPTIEEALEESYNDDEDDISEASYLECPEGHDSDDGWAIEAFDKIYVCGVCHVRYTSLDAAAKCCDEEENN